MAQDFPRKAELLDFIRENQAALPWPQIQEALLRQGFTAAEIAAAVEELFPGQRSTPKKKKKSGVWGGMVGAVVGVLIWVLLAILYRSGR